MKDVKIPIASTENQIPSYTLASGPSLSNIRWNFKNFSEEWAQF